MAMPPRMLPTAIPSSPLREALAVMAISGRLVTTARRISPPSAWPSPNLSRSTSVVSERRMPATQTAPAASAKTKASADRGKEPNTLSIESPNPPQLTQRTRRRLRPEALPCDGEQAHRVAQGFHLMPYTRVAGEQSIGSLLRHHKADAPLADAQAGGARRGVLLDSISGLHDQEHHVHALALAQCD